MVGEEVGIDSCWWYGPYVSDDPADVVTWKVWAKNTWTKQPGVSAKSTGNSKPFPLLHTLYDARIGSFRDAIVKILPDYPAHTRIIVGTQLKQRDTSPPWQ